MDPREEKLPAWAQKLLADLRQKVKYGNEPLLREVSRLRPQVEQLKARNGALTELLSCAARGGHLASIDIINVIEGYDLQLVKQS